MQVGLCVIGVPAGGRKLQGAEVPPVPALQCKVPTSKHLGSNRKDRIIYSAGRRHFTSRPLPSILRAVDNGKIMIRGCLVVQESIHRSVCIATPPQLCSSRTGSCCPFVTCLLLNHGQLAN